MDPERRRRIEALFDQLLDEPRASWEAILDGACGGDEDIRSEVKKLLNAHERSEGILENTSFLGRPFLPEDQAIPAGGLVGNYRVLWEVGRGGMGIVYRAERADGHFQRTVALKLGTRADPALATRIVAERQFLASLQHPNIARLFDGGVTEDGRPFLVMEFVNGRPIDQYCDRARLHVRERLRLFRTVLRAVEHAHRNLIVHRDLKPSNIIVTPRGEVKLLDFGIAQLLGSAPHRPGSPESSQDYRAFTPEYSSPEQIRGEPVTTACDVYSLGVVLSELLFGTRWAPEGDEEEASPEDHSPVEVAEHRGTTTWRLRKDLKGDLEAMVARAMSPDPAKRYGSAALFLHDIRNHLNDRPVLAHQGGSWYRTRKFLIRHRTAAVGVALVVLALFSGAGAFAWQAGLTARERDRAEEARREAEEISGFLLGLFQGSEPEETPGDTVSALDLLRRGISRAAALESEPLIQARMLQVMARVSQSLGRYGQASELAGDAFELVERHRPDGHPDLADALLAMALALRADGEFDSAKVVLSRAVQEHEARDDTDPVGFGEVLEELADVEVYLGQVARAEELLGRGASMREQMLGRDASPTLNTLNVLGVIYRRLGRYDEAEAVFRDVLHRRRSSSVDDPLALAVDLLQLGMFVRDARGDLVEAEAFFREALELTREPKGRAKRHEVWALTSLASVMELAGEWEEAERLLSEAVDTRMKTYGELHPLVSEDFSNYGEFLTRAGRPEEAEAYQRRAVEIDLGTVGGRHIRHASTLAGLGRTLAAQGRFQEADSILGQALEIRISAQGPQVPIVAQVSADLADIKIRRGQFEEAEELLERAAAILREQPSGSEVSRNVHAAFTRLYDAWDRPVEAARHRALIGGVD